MNSETGIRLLTERIKRLEADLADCRALAASQQQVIDENCETLSQMRDAESLLRRLQAPAPPPDRMRTHARPPRDRSHLRVVKAVIPAAALGAVGSWLAARKMHVAAAAAALTVGGAVALPQIMPGSPPPAAGAIHPHAQPPGHPAQPAVVVRHGRRRQHGSSTPHTLPSTQPAPVVTPAPPQPSPRATPAPSPLPVPVPSPTPSLPVPLPTPTPHGHKHHHHRVCLPLLGCVPGV